MQFRMNAPLMLSSMMVFGFVQHALAGGIPFTAQTVDLFQNQATIGPTQSSWDSSSWSSSAPNLYKTEEFFYTAPGSETFAGHMTYMEIGATGMDGWRGNNYYGYYSTGHGGSYPSTPTNAQVDIVMKGTFANYGDITANTRTNFGIRMNQPGGFPSINGGVSVEFYIDNTLERNFTWQQNIGQMMQNNVDYAFSEVQGKEWRLIVRMTGVADNLSDGTFGPSADPYLWTAYTGYYESNNIPVPGIGMAALAGFGLARRRRRR